MDRVFLIPAGWNYVAHAPKFLRRQTGAYVGWTNGKRSLLAPINDVLKPGETLTDFDAIRDMADAANKGSSGGDGLEISTRDMSHTLPFDMPALLSSKAVQTAIVTKVEWIRCVQGERSLHFVPLAHRDGATDALADLWSLVAGLSASHAFFSAMFMQSTGQVQPYYQSSPEGRWRRIGEHDGVRLLSVEDTYSILLVHAELAVAAHAADMLAHESRASDQHNRPYWPLRSILTSIMGVHRLAGTVRTALAERHADQPLTIERPSAPWSKPIKIAEEAELVVGRIGEYHERIPASESLTQREARGKDDMKGWIDPSEPVPWLGTRRCVNTTRDRAVRWIGGGTFNNRDAVDFVMDAMLRRPTNSSSPFTPLLRAELERVGVGDLEGRQFGAQAIALLIVENEIDASIDRRGNTTVFAEAMTAYLAAINSTTIEPQMWARFRVLRLLTHWLRRARLQPPKNAYLGIDASIAPRWRDLCVAAPWVRWYASQRLDPREGISITPSELVDYLALLRPTYSPKEERREEGPASIQLRPEPLRGRWNSLYKLDTAFQMSDHDLSSLAQALDGSLSDPARAARMLQAVDVPQEVVDRAYEFIRVGQEDAAGPEAFMAMLDDGGDQRRIIVANLHTRRWLDYRVGPNHGRLPPSAISEPGATLYCAAPRDIGPDDIATVGNIEISLVAPVPALETQGGLTLAAIPLDLFRGRQEQLARLLQPLEGRGPRMGSYIFGPRRAGKSTLAYRVSKDPVAGGALWVDMSNTPASASDYPMWQAAVTRQLRRQVSRHLAFELGDHLDPGADLVEAIEVLDTLLDGRPPVVLVLDEFDVLLLPEGGSGGRRAAGRLGNLVCQNLVLVGTVQRFHRSIQELKAWQGIECPASLSWEDGVTYFCPPLASHDLNGPHVLYPKRPIVTPRTFARTIESRIGLRPYYWGQLRSRFEAQARAVASARVARALDLDRHMDTMITEDAHLSAMLQPDVDYSPAEMRRQDIFSVDEQRALLVFAETTGTANSLPVALVERWSSADAIEGLIERAVLSHSERRDALRVAVPLVQEYLQLHAADLRAVVVGEGSAGDRIVPPAGRAVEAPENFASPADLIAIELARASTGGFKLDVVANRVRRLFPEFARDWGGYGKFADYLRAAFPGSLVQLDGGGGGPHGNASPGQMDGDISTAPGDAPRVDTLIQRCKEILQRATGAELPVSELSRQLRSEGLIGPRGRRSVGLLTTLQRAGEGLVIVGTGPESRVRLAVDHSNGDGA